MFSPWDPPGPSGYRLAVKLWVVETLPLKKLIGTIPRIVRMRRSQLEVF